MFIFTTAMFYLNAVYIVKEPSYLEVSMLAGHQLCNMTSCIPKSSTWMSQVYIVKEPSYLELSMLAGHQLWNMTSCIPKSATYLSITYTMVTTIETQTTIIGVMINKSLQEVL